MGEESSTGESPHAVHLVMPADLVHLARRPYMLAIGEHRRDIVASAGACAARWSAGDREVLGVAREGVATRGEALHHCATIGVRASGHREVTDAESLDSHTLVAGDGVHGVTRRIRGASDAISRRKRDALIGERVARCLRDSRRSTDGINASECDGVVCQRVTRRLSSGSWPANKVFTREHNRRICEDVHGALGGASYRCDAILGGEGELLIREVF